MIIVTSFRITITSESAFAIAYGRSGRKSDWIIIRNFGRRGLPWTLLGVFYRPVFIIHNVVIVMMRLDARKMLC